MADSQSDWRKEVQVTLGLSPRGLTAEQREVFDRENPEWRDFFADR